MSSPGVQDLRTRRRRAPASIVPFLAGVVSFSIPFWLAGVATDSQLLPGLPIGSLMIVAPLVSAVLLTYREGGVERVATLLGRALDYRKIPLRRWFVPILLLYPGVTAVSYAALLMLDSRLPDSDVRIAAAPLLLGVFLIAGLIEELGWSGYALDPMQQRWGPLRASLVLGTAWALWHVVPLVQVGRPPYWILWWCLYTVSSRVIYTWIYNGAGQSVFAVALLHAVANLSWQLFPNRGSHWDPRLVGSMLATAAIVVVVSRWPGTGTRSSEEGSSADSRLIIERRRPMGSGSCETRSES